MAGKGLRNKKLFLVLGAVLVVLAVGWFLYKSTWQEQRLEVKMSRVQVELERVISGWCDAEANSYTAQAGLPSLWRRKYPTTPSYNPQGITKLVAEIGNNSLFKNCSAAKNIGPGYFLPGGAIQTVGDLNDFLTPCENG